MITLSIKNLLSDPIRFGVSVMGVAFSVFLIVLFLSLYRGFDEEIDDYIESVAADLWVVQRGTREFTGVSILPEAMADEIRARGGDAITGVSSLLSRPTDIIVDGEPFDAHAIGYDTSTGVGGPRVTKGKERLDRGEVIIDEVLGDLAGLGIGDPVTVGGREFEVVGISTGSNFVFTQLVFIGMEDARQVLFPEGGPDVPQLGEVKLTNFVLVNIKGPGFATAVKNAIEDNAPFAEVYPQEEFVENTREELTATLVPLLVMIVLVGFVVGTAVVGLTIYTLTIERVREYGILKAVGFTNQDLFRVVIQQSFMAGVLGFGLGLLFVMGAARLIEEFLPQFATLLRVPDLIGVFGATMVMAAVASYIPIRRLSRLDPVIVFNP